MMGRGISIGRIFPAMKEQNEELSYTCSDCMVFFSFGRLNIIFRLSPYLQSFVFIIKQPEQFKYELPAP